MIALNNEYFIQQFEDPDEKALLPQLSEVRLLGKFKYYTVNSPLLSDLYNPTFQVEDVSAYRLNNRH